MIVVLLLCVVELRVGSVQNTTSVFVPMTVYSFVLPQTAVRLNLDG